HHTHNQPLSDAIAQGLRRRNSHRHCRLACSDDPYRPASDATGRDGARDELTGVHGSDAGLCNCQEIVSKTVERTSQCERFGSDQADRPVTMSNFLRSDATNWGASSCEESCSSSEMILVRAASTSVIAVSE